METTNGCAPLMCLPLPLRCLPSVVFGEIDVQMFMCSDVCSIGLEIGHELGLGAGGLLHDFFRKGLIIEKDHLLYREVDGKVHNTWVLMVNLMPHESTDCLICTNIGLPNIIIYAYLIFREL